MLRVSTLKLAVGLRAVAVVLTDDRRVGQRSIVGLRTAAIRATYDWVHTHVAGSAIIVTVTCKVDPVPVHLYVFVCDAYARALLPVVTTRGLGPLAHLRTTPYPNRRIITAAARVYTHRDALITGRALATGLANFRSTFARNRAAYSVRRVALIKCIAANLTTKAIRAVIASDEHLVTGIGVPSSEAPVRTAKAMTTTEGAYFTDLLTATNAWASDRI